MFNLRSVDLNLLTVFEAVYELGSVSAAAVRLALSKSATSHALSRLREACGDELFVRAGQGLAPTPVAATLYPAIKQALEALRTSLAEATGFDPSRSNRRFHLSIPHPLGPFYALDLIAAAAAIAPGIELTFDTASRPRGLEDELRDGTVELAIDWLPVELDAFVNRKLFDEQLVLIVRNNHPTVNAGVTLEDLWQAKFVAPHRRRRTEQLPPALREFYQVGFKEVLHVSELLEIPTVVTSTDLLGIFPSSMGPRMSKRLGLQMIPIPLELPALPIYMIWHESRRNDAAHGWLREVVVQELGRSGQG
jgi:LysR family transcriptional activator for leuABCD operon